MTIFLDSFFDFLSGFCLEHLPKWFRPKHLAFLLSLQPCDCPLAMAVGTSLPALISGYPLSLSSTDNSTEISGVFTQPSETLMASVTPTLAITALGGPAVPLEDSQQSLWLTWLEWVTKTAENPSSGWSPRPPACSTAKGRWTSLEKASSVFPFSYSKTCVQLAEWPMSPMGDPISLKIVFNLKVITIQLGYCLTLRKPGLCLVSRADLKATVSNITLANLGDINHR